MKYAVFSLFLLLALAGCRHQVTGYKPEPIKGFALVVPRGCINAIQLTTETYCRGKDLNSLSCYHLKLDKKVACEQIEVLPGD